MATFRRRKRDGKIQSWFRKTWNHETGAYEFDYGWRDEPDDAVRRFLETRDPKREGCIVIPVEDFEDGGAPVLSINDFLELINKPVEVCVTCG